MPFLNNIWNKYSALFSKYNLDDLKISSLFYFVGFIICLFIFFKFIDEKNWMYVGFGILSIGSFIYLIKLYDRVKKNTFFVILFFIIITVSAVAATIIVDLNLIKVTGIDSKGFSNASYLLTAVLSSLLIMLILLFLVFIFEYLCLMIIMAFRYILYLLAPLLRLLNIELNLNKESYFVDFINFLHFLGLVSAILVSSEIFSMLINNKVVFYLIDTLDYKIMHNTPNVPHDKRIALHDGFYSIIESDENGNKYIVTKEIDK